MTTYLGSCHCNAVTYHVTGDFSNAVRCNCSLCKRKGLLLAFVPDTAFTLLTGADATTTYTFNKRHIDHIFCMTCGVQSYSHGHDGNGNYMTAINLNCLEDFDTTKIAIQDFDGASL